MQFNEIYLALNELAENEIIENNERGKIGYKIENKN